MSDINVSIDTRGLSSLLRSLQDGERQLSRIVIQTMQKGMKLSEAFAKENLTRKILGTRSGFLRSSIRSRVVVGEGGSGGGSTIVGELGILKPKDRTVPIYGAAQEFGGQAVPTGGRKVMTIPLAAALTPAGNTRFTALEAKGLYDRTFWWHDVLYGVKALKGKGRRQRSRRNGLNFRAAIVGGKSQRRDKIVPLFWGAKKVKIGGGPGVGRGYLRDARDRVVPDLNRAFLLQVAELFNLRKAHGN